MWKRYLIARTINSLSVLFTVGFVVALVFLSTPWPMLIVWSVLSVAGFATFYISLRSRRRAYAALVSIGPNLAPSGNGESSR